MVHYGYELSTLPKDTVPKSMFVSRRGYETLLRRLVLDKTRFPNIEQITGTITEIHPDKMNSSRVGSITVREEGSDMVKINGEIFIGGFLSVDGHCAHRLLDCTGSTQGLSWLDKAGYGRSDPRDHKSLPLHESRIAYDPKIRYTTLEFPVSADLIKRMSLPDSGMFGVIHCGITHPWKNDTSVYVLRVDGDFSKYS